MGRRGSTDSYHVAQDKAQLAETTRGCLGKSHTNTAPQYRGLVERRPFGKHTHTHNPVHTHTLLMVTTWLDQNKASGPPLFSAELVFLKAAQSQGERRVFWWWWWFGGWGGSKTFIGSPCVEAFWLEEKQNDGNMQLLDKTYYCIPSH